MKGQFLFETLEGSVPQECMNLEITDVTHDSREVKSGSLFVCLVGYTSDGHQFIENAVEKGACGIVVQEGSEYKTPQVPVITVKDTRIALSVLSERFYGNPSSELLVVGVTGTNGKTTTTYMLQNIFEKAGQSCGLVGTIFYKAGDHRYEASNTTPESNLLSRMFRQMRDGGNVCCVMEVSSHSLAMHRVDSVDFDYGIFTNLTEDHLDFHPDFEDYFQAKKRLFAFAKKAALVNIDDPYGNRLYKELQEEGKRVLSLSAKDPSADYYAKVLKKTDTYSTVKIYKMGQHLLEMTIHIPGSFSVYNGLSAFAAAYEAGVSAEKVAAGIESLGGVPGRFELVPNEQGVIAIVDYAHTPDALINVLDTAKEFKKGKLYTVFGCGGDRDRTKRPLMGAASGERSDYCIITSDNPRTEDPFKILADVEEGMKRTDCPYEVIEDRKEAIRRALALYEPGDVLVVAGKGHEDYQIIGTVKHHFDDKEVIAEILESMK